MNAFASEYSSGCDSGWTVYLEQSVLSPNDHHTNFIESETCFFSSGKKIVDEDDDDDQSMVSDASSGPPLKDGIHSCNAYFSSAFEGMQNNTHHVGKRKKTKEQRRGRHEGKHQDSAEHVDDTASSTVSKKKFSLTKKNQASMNGLLEYSQGFSATRFKGKSK